MAFSSSHSGDVLSCSVDDYLFDNIQAPHQDYQGFPMPMPPTPPPINDWIQNLPIGFRFRPTDEELVMQFLQLESFGFDSSGIIKHANIYDFHPKELRDLVNVDHGDGKMYFYTHLQKMAKNSVGRNSVRRIKSKSTDYWKLTQTNKEVLSSQGNIQGYKSSLVFYEGTNKTQWLMQEYKLQPSKSSTAAEELVLAVVYLYDRKRKRDDDGDS